MITRIEAQRYRCFERLDVALKPYQVLVGRNGTGKSTLLDLPILLGEMFQERNIGDPLFKPRGLRPARAQTPADIFFGRRGDSCVIAVEAKLPENIAEHIGRTSFEALPKRQQTLWLNNPGRRPDTIRYELGLGLRAGALEIFHEFVSLLPEDRSLFPAPVGLWGDTVDEDDPLVRSVVRRTRDGVTLFQPEVREPAEGRRPPIPAKVPVSAPAISGVPLDLSQYPACLWLVNFLSRDVLPVCLDLGSMREDQRPPGLGYRVARDGTTLPWSVIDLAKEPRRYEEWHEHISRSIPFLSKVEGRQREDDNHAYLEVTYDTGFSVRSVGLSDGTLTFLALTILPFLDNVPALITVEEPENGVHPKAIETILESLSLMDPSQVIVTSHSPIVVAVTPLEQLLCLSQTKTEGVQIVRGDQHPFLAHWHGTPDLGTLHSAGVL